MNRSSIHSRQEACYYLRVRENASKEEIKRAYHLLAKQYHPDTNPKAEVKEYYIRICEAYEYLSTHPSCETGAKAAAMQQERPTRIFQSSTQVKEQYRRQKLFEEERRKQQKREVQLRQKKAEARYEQPKRVQSISKEEEILEKIRAIWLAETIKRQIALDKEKKEAENKRKLYQAFMQQKMQEEESRTGNSDFCRNSK